MARVYVFADEAGCRTFKRHPAASRYFILTTIATPDCEVGHALLNLRRQLAWEGVRIYDGFHATEDSQAVRDRVFETLAQYDIRVDATILDKPKAAPHLQADEDRFYKLAWYLHMKHVAPAVAKEHTELFVTGASIGTRRQREKLAESVRDVIAQVSPTVIYQAAYWPAGTDPCLQAADYCCWAIQRKWEKSDDRSYKLIAGSVASEFDAFRPGRTLYY